MHPEDVSSICNAISNAEVDIRPITEALYEIVEALKGIDCEVANFKHAVHTRLDAIEDRLAEIRDETSLVAAVTEG